MASGFSIRLWYSGDGSSYHAPGRLVAEYQPKSKTYSASVISVNSSELDNLKSAIFFPSSQTIRIVSRCCIKPYY